MRLIYLFPGIFLPPIGPSHINLKDDSPKKISYLSKFINALSQNRLVRSTEIYKAFFSLSQEEFENKKKEIDKIPKPKSLSQFNNMEGVIKLKISKEIHIQKAINKKIDLFKNLDTAFNTLLTAMEEMSKKMKDLSKAFEDLKKLFEENNESGMENYFEKFTNFMDDWATGYKNQRTFFKNELKYYFKYMYKELLPLFTTLKSSRNAYESSFKKVKKSTMPNPKDEKSMLHLKRYYSYHLNSFLYECSSLVFRHQERISNQLISLDENRNTFMQDYDHFIKLIHCNL